MLVLSLLLLSAFGARAEDIKEDNVGARAEDIKEDNGVLVLTNDNFEQAIKDNEHVLVEFYAPWCGHCKSLAPEYEKAAKALEEAKSPIKLAKVDATIEKELAEKYKVQGFPTLKFYKNGEAKEYNGPREADGILSWLEKKTGPPAKELTTVKEAKDLTDSKNVVAMGFFKEQDSDQAKAFLEAAENEESIPYVITSSKAIWSEYKVAKDSIVLIKNFDDKRADYEGAMTAEDIGTWVTGESFPLVSEFIQENLAKIFGSKVKTHFLLLVSKKDKDIEKHLEALRPAAMANKGEIIFVHVDSDLSENDQVMDYFGITKEETPKYLLMELEKGTKFISDKSAVVAEEVTKFVEDFFAKKLKRTLKSADLPEDWDKEPVKVLVSSNFKEVALDKTKDVFVEFYAPWCGHCKSLAPIWDELGAKYKDSDSIVIAKMDSTANEVEEVEVQSFPTIKFIRKETNEIVDYKGKRDFESFVKFIESGGEEVVSEPSPAEDAEDEDSKEDVVKDEL